MEVQPTSTRHNCDRTSHPVTSVGQPKWFRDTHEQRSPRLHRISCPCPSATIRRGGGLRRKEGLCYLQSSTVRSARCEPHRPRAAQLDGRRFRPCPATLPLFPAPSDLSDWPISWLSKIVASSPSLYPPHSTLDSDSSPLRGRGDHVPNSSTGGLLRSFCARFDWGAMLT